MDISCLNNNDLASSLSLRLKLQFVFEGNHKLEATGGIVLANYRNNYALNSLIICSCANVTKHGFELINTYIMRLTKPSQVTMMMSWMSIFRARLDARHAK